LNYRDVVRKSDTVWPSADYQCGQWRICEALDATYLSLGDMALAIAYCKKVLPVFEESKVLFVCSPCLFYKAHRGRKSEGFYRHWETTW